MDFSERLDPETARRLEEDAREETFEEYYLRTRGVPVDWEGDPALDPIHREAERRDAAIGNLTGLG